MSGTGSNRFAMDAYQACLENAQTWAHEAIRDHWILESDAHELLTLDNRSPSSLFDPETQRPLVAAFFGGTGAGKSTLLNRLAGQAIAKTGVERPTSREVSLYLHDSIGIEHLSAHFALDGIRIARHHDTDARGVVWIDMPDIDSVETHNLELVKSWLPHIDVLIYVVSPERYRDDRGWRMLQRHGRDHAWVFVMNQWDRAHPVQFEAFQQLLLEADFTNPVLLRTDCRALPQQAIDDDFSTLKQVLSEISGQHNLKQLEVRAERARIQQLKEAIESVLGCLGHEHGYTLLNSAWQEIWTDAQKDLMTGLAWPIQSIVTAFIGREANPLSRSIDLQKEAQTENRTLTTKQVLWDDWADGRLKDAFDRLIVEAGNLGLPVLPLKMLLDQLAIDTGKNVVAKGQLSLRQALANPGNLVQRLSLRISGLLSLIMPLAAIGWVAFQVTKGYYESATQHLDYLGTDFAVHSLLLILVAWLLPFFAYTRLKPSIERTAQRGLKEGISSALELTSDHLSSLMTETELKRQKVFSEGRQLVGNLEPPVANKDGSTGILERILPSQQSDPVIH